MEINEFYKKFESGFNKAMKGFKVNGDDLIMYKEWTEGIGNYLKKTFENEHNYICICKHNLAKKTDKKEFLTLDYTVFKNDEATTLDNLATREIIYAVEHENQTDHNRIAYNISKLLNISAKNKVMIGYVKKPEKEGDEDKEKEEIFEKLKKQIKEMKSSKFREEERLLIILGHNGMTNSSHYKAKLFYLKSKRSKNLNSKNKKEE